MWITSAVNETLLPLSVAALRFIALAIAVTALLLMDCLYRVTADFWQTWKEFEVKHGNEDTLREMLRIKRSVQAVYNTQVNMMASAMMKETGPIGTVSDLAPTLTLGLKDDMWRLEAKGSESDVKVRPQRYLVNMFTIFCLEVWRSSGTAE